MSENISPPLRGLKVVEIGVAMAGPFCAMMLGDYGADVIKVERVGTGDDSRHWPPFFHGEMGYYFAAANRNKKSLSVDLKNPDGLDVVRRLVASADILIDNYRPGALDRVGLGYEAMAALNPRLIYCSISGFGRNGPRREERANDIFMQAFSGGMSITGEPDRSPSKMGLSVADIGAGMFGVIGIMMALQVRHATGRGQRVDTSLMEGQLSMLSYHLTSFFASGKTPQRNGGAGQVNVPYQAFKAADDWLVIAAFTERMWQNTCDALGHSEWATDPKFATATARITNRDELVTLITEVLSGQPSAYWQKLLVSHGVPCSPVNSIDKVVEDEQVLAQEMIAEMELAGRGVLRMAGLPIKMEKNPGSLELAPPRLGEHTEPILRAAGYSAGEIDRMESSGVVEIWNKTIPAGRAVLAD